MPYVSPSPVTMDDPRDSWREDGGAAPPGTAGLRPPEVPIDPMEFLSRSWSLSALEVSKALSAPPLPTRCSAAAADVLLCGTAGGSIPEEEEDIAAELDDAAALAGSNGFPFASSATSQLVMERIMSQSQQEVSPLTSGRLSHSSGPLNGGQSCESLTDSPPVSPSENDDIKYCRANNPGSKPQYRGSTKTVGRWLKDRREKKKEETRVHNAQLHAAVSVAGVAAAVAAIAAATAAASGNGKDDLAARTDMAVASAATLVAAQCVEAAESLGVEREHLASVVRSAVNVRTPGDIVTLTAAAATALRGAATLKARALKDVWNIAAVIPVEKGGGLSGGNHHNVGNHHSNSNHHHHRRSMQPNEADLIQEENFLGLCSQEMLARGTELLKRTRKGDLHWKLVSVYIHRTGQVMLKMKSRHVAGTITKKKKNVVVNVCRDVQAWPGRHLLEGSEQRRYFGLKTAEGRIIEFECRSQREFDIWTQGTIRLLKIVAEKRGAR